MADIVRPLEIDEHQVGHVVGADVLAFQHGGERVAFEPLEDPRVAELRGVADVVPHPGAARLLPVLARDDRLERLRHGVAGGIGLPPSGLAREVAGGQHAAAVDEAGAVADEAGRRADGAALPDDDGAAFRLDVPDVGERERHQLAGIETVVRLLRLAGDAVEQVVDGQPVDARLAAGPEVGVADRGERRHRRHVGVAEPRALAPQPRQRRHRVGVGVEVVGARAVEHEERHHARPRRRRRSTPGAAAGRAPSPAAPSPAVPRASAPRPAATPARSTPRA